jgi:hypothetical protein
MPFIGERQRCEEEWKLISRYNSGVNVSFGYYVPATSAGQFKPDTGLGLIAYK